MSDEPRELPTPARERSGSGDGSERLGRGGGRLGKKRRKRERRTGSETGARLRSAREGMGESSTDIPAAPPPREFQAEGETWVAWEGGRASAGLPSSPAATLIEVFFGRDAEGLRPERTVLVVASSVEEIPLERLRSIWTTASPYRHPRDAAAGEKNRGPRESRGR